MLGRSSLGLLASMAFLMLADGSANRSESKEGKKRHVIEMRDLTFSPSAITVSSGDTVVWINRDIVPHTATAKDERWDSKIISPEDSWEMEVTGSGSQSYFCRLHPRMVGSLEVR